MFYFSRILIVLFIICGLQCASIVFVAWNGMPLGVSALAVGVVSFAILSTTHAIWRHGIWRALVLVAVPLLGGLALEIVGVETGAPFGRYHYNEEMGWKILGLVPAVVPIAWFVLTYNTYVFADILFGAAFQRRAISGATRGIVVLQTLGVSILGAMAMTAWDLGMEDQMVDRNGWHWPDGGWYFGVPLHNFIGWLFAAFAMHTAYRLFEMLAPTSAPVDDSHWCSDLPVGIYALIWITTVALAFAHSHHGPAWTGFFAMGSFLFAYLLLRRRRNRSTKMLFQ